MFTRKKYFSLRYIHNNFARSFFIICSVLVFFILLIISLKSFHIVHQDGSNFVSNSEVESNFPNFMISLQNLKNSTFPEVKEFETSKKKFDNEDARLVGFSLRNTNIINKQHNSEKIIYLATTYFDEFNPKHYYFLHFNAETFNRYQCPVSNCYVTNSPSNISQAHAVLFHVRDLEVFSLPSYRTPDQIWILYSMEPPWLEIRDMSRFNGVFNWTMSYRRDSDVLVTYGFIGRKPQSNTENTNIDLNSIFKQKSNKAVWYVSNCETDSNREQYVAHLRKIYPVDIIGGCGVEGCRPAETKKCYIKIAQQYKFYLAFENAICRDYVTEKLFNSLEYHIVPVTFGGSDYSKITPNNSIINAMEFSSPEELGRFLWKVSLNETFYLSYFKWRETHRSYLQPWMCDLCEKLHNPVSYKTNNHLVSWWNEGKSCQRWSTEGLKPIVHHAFPVYYKNLSYKL